MSYIFRGFLCGRLCSDCVEPLSQATILLYRVRDQKQVAALAVANPKDTFAVLDAEAIESKAGALLAEIRSDDAGNFEVVLGDKQDYEGEAFEIDVRLSNVPRYGKEAPDRSEPVQFTVTTVQPQWRETENGLVAAWRYCLPYRFWCAVRALFDAWVICGQVVDCETQLPVPGVKVTAFDADWIQDDVIGSAVTDGAGHFRIDYASIDFRLTPLSPPFFWEVVSGPDLYFKIETAGGVALLDEPRSRGKQPDRENVGHCFCVELCVQDPEDPYENPQFTHIGDFNISADIDLVSGLTNKAKTGHGGPNYGFFSALKLKGYCPKTLPGGGPTDYMHYRFLFVDPDTSAETPITGSMVAEVVVGARVVPWDQFGTGIQLTYQDIIIRGSGTASAPDSDPTPPGPAPHGPVPAHILIPDAQGWVRVDQKAMDGGFYGPLVRFNTNAVPSLVGGGAPGPGAGNNPASVAQNGKIVSIIYETATDPTNPATYNRQMLQARILVNNWIEVRQLAIQQFISGASGSCTPLTSDLDINYTTDHQQLANWSMSITSAATIPGGAPVLPSGSGPRGGFGTHHVDISAWPSCSYQLRLHSRRSLTNGEVDDDSDNTLITFCK